MSEQLMLPGLDTPTKHKTRVRDLETRIASLEAENVRLKAALKKVTTDLTLNESKREVN